MHTPSAAPNSSSPKLWLCTVVALLVGVLGVSAPATALVYTYENTTAGNIPEVGSNALCDGAVAPLIRTFSVPDSFTVATISLGLNITHPARGQVRASLVAPDGTTSLVFLTQDAGADTNDNYDIYLSPLSDGGGTNPLNDGDTDPIAEPYYHRLVNLASNFYTGNSAGTWSLRICDRNTDNNDGTLNRARLVLTSAATATSACSSRTTYVWCPGCSPSPPAGATSNPFPGAGITAGGVTITETSTTLANATASGRNFDVVNTETGGEFGFFAIEWDASAAQVESVRSEATFQTSVPVRDLQWKLMDMDRNNWEDYIRVRGLFGGNEVRYSISQSAAPSYQIGGEILETDSDSSPADTFGNAFWNFSGPVTSVRTEYWSGDDFANPSQQFIGFGTALFCAFDYGDAPATYGTSARHTMGADQLYLGSQPGDGETAAQSGATATIDDATNPAGGTDDEDGVPTPFPNMTAGPGGTYTVPGIVVHNVTGATATLCGWIDFDTNGGAQDGTFESDEGSCITVPASGNNANCTESPAGTFTCSMSWTVPADYVRTGSATYARFRVTPASAGMTTASFNTAIDQPGEVEDYQIAAGTLPVTVAKVESQVTPSGDVAVRWSTASEAGNVGFRIWGERAVGDPVLLATVRSHQPDSFVPQHYEASGSGKGIRSILIEDISILGVSRVHGPFAIGAKVGEDPEGAENDWASIRGETALAQELDRRSDGLAVDEPNAKMAGPARGGALLSVHQAGIHRVTYEQLAAAGVRLNGISVDNIALENNGLALPRVVTPARGTFGPGSYVEFYLDPSLDLWTPTDVLVLRNNAATARSPKLLQWTPGPQAATRAEDVHEAQNAYSFSAPNGDPWFEAQLLAWGGPATLTRTFDLPDLDEGPVEIEVRGWGYGDFDGAAPDHHVVVTMNGQEVASERFDGITPLDLKVDVTGLATETGNQLEIRVPGDVAYPFDNFAYDGFTVRYARRAVALDERFSGDIDAAGPISIGGFADGSEVAIWRVENGQYQRALAIASGGSVPAYGGATIHAASAQAMLVPDISAQLPTPAYSSNADYVIVTHPSLAGALDGLVALERAKGLSVDVVTVDRIYAAYSDFAPSSAAIGRFFRASSKLRLKYALLAGADTTDPYDHLGIGSVSYVPSAYVAISPIVAFAPTDEPLVDANGDGVGDVPVGRLPARTPAELQSMIDKIVRWEASVAQGGRTALLSSGASDTQASLAALNDTFKMALSGWNVSTAAVDTVGSSAARAAVLGAINGGTRLVSFVGHSSMGQWDWTPLLKWQDVDALTNAAAPNLITAWGCWNSYYVEPNVESLGARLLRATNAGAAGVIGATTLTSEESHQALGSLFYQQVNAGARRVGDALRAAKQTLALRGGEDDAVLGMTLLGDPAMSLPAH